MRQLLIYVNTSLESVALPLMDLRTFTLLTLQVRSVRMLIERSTSCIFKKKIIALDNFILFSSSAKPFLKCFHGLLNCFSTRNLL